MRRFPIMRDDITNKKRNYKERVKMVKFEDAKKGYNKEQVDSYIKTINDEYQKVLAEYQALEEEVEEAKNDTSHNDAIAAALINAEIAGKQIIANANLEAKRVTSEATREVGRITKKKTTVLNEVKELTKMLTAVLGGKLDDDDNTGEATDDSE